MGLRTRLISPGLFHQRRGTFLPEQYRITSEFGLPSQSSEMMKLIGSGTGGPSNHAITSSEPACCVSGASHLLIATLLPWPVNQCSSPANGHLSLSALARLQEPHRAWKSAGKPLRLSHR